MNSSSYPALRRFIILFQKISEDVKAKQSLPFKKEIYFHKIFLSFGVLGSLTHSFAEQPVGLGFSGERLSAAAPPEGTEDAVGTVMPSSKPSASTCRSPRLHRGRP
jgi:hypothetical protein